jgi:hypothetical protein
VGPQGATGSQGPKGDAGGTLASFDSLAGLHCSTAGTLKIDYGSGGGVTLTCVTSSGGGGGGSGSTAIKVNEVQTGTSASASDEFVELYNAGSTSVDLSGWKVVYRSAAGTSDTTVATIPASTTLAAGGFYLLAGSSYAGSATADQTFSTGRASTGGAIGVRDSSGTLVDAAGWGTATNALVEGTATPAPPATAAPGSSIARIPDGHDTGANASDLTVTATATPRAANK